MEGDVELVITKWDRMQHDIGTTMVGLLAYKGKMGYHTT